VATYSELACDRTLFELYLFSACRINEAVTFKTVDTYETSSRVGPKLIIRIGNTQLQNYLEVRDKRVLGAVTALSLLSLVGEVRRVITSQLC
jgi:hypothetical protein